MIDDIVALADYLDKEGFHKEAAEVDKSIEELWESMRGSPPPMSGHQPASWNEAFDRLVANFNARATEVTPEVMGWVRGVIADTARGLSEKPQETSGYQKRIESADEVYYLSPKAVELAESIANLIEEIRLGQEQLDAGTGGPELQGEVAHDAQSLNQYISVLNNMLTADERNAVQSYVASRTTQKGRKVVLVPDRRGEDGE